MSERIAKKVLLLGWDSADLQIINPLVDRGEMPNLATLIDNGVMGNLSSLQPILSPILWTSIATGKQADQHGIHGFIEPKPDGSGVRPVTSTSVTATPMWEILTQQGLASAVVGWFATYPADRVPGLVVSDLFCSARGESFEEWPLPNRIVSPMRLQELLKDLRVHPTDLTLHQLTPFIPDVARINFDEDERPGQLINYLARCATNHAAATYIAEHEDWDLLAVYFETIDRISHCFMEYHPPRLERVSEEDFQRYQNVVAEMYRFHDLMLGRYLELAGPDATVVLVSDHGFYNGNNRPASSPGIAKGNPMEWHRALGTFIASGPGIQRDQLVHGSSILDIAPTILHLLGIPVPLDMEGRVLHHILAAPTAVTHVASYPRLVDEQPQVPGEDDVWEAQEAIKQLVALGYIDAPSDDGAKAVEDALAGKLSNMAQVFRSKKKFADAIAALEELLALRPQHQTAKIWLAVNHMSLGNFNQARELAEESLVENPMGPWANFLHGQLLLREGAVDAALACFQNALQIGFQNPRIHFFIGTAFLKKQQFADAETAFRAALALDEENADALDGLGVSLHSQARNDEALEALLGSVSLVYARPLVHFHLGMVLAALGHVGQAMEAFQNACVLNPDFAAAREAQTALRGRMNTQVGRAIDAHLSGRQGIPVVLGEALMPRREDVRRDNEIPGHAQDVITIVSGIPRSGTSMVMQMLDRAGMSLLSDGQRRADEHNPRGYYEYGPVKGTLSDNSWIAGARGKVVKVVHALLPGLSPDYRYRIVFMERALGEIVASQQAMLGRSSGERTEPDKLEDIYSRQLAQTRAWLAGQKNITTLYLSYNSMVNDTVLSCQRLATFLELDCDTDSLVAAVDQTLHRQRR